MRVLLRIKFRGLDVPFVYAKRVAKKEPKDPKGPKLIDLSFLAMSTKIPCPVLLA
jgi:hypothetical protein